MNKRIYVSKSARKVLDASLRRALGKDGMEQLAQKKIKIVCLDGEWWIIGMQGAKKKEEGDNNG